MNDWYPIGTVPRGNIGDWTEVRARLLLEGNGGQFVMDGRDWRWSREIDAYVVLNDWHPISGIIEAPQGQAGEDGQDGQDGTNGTDGQDGQDGQDGEVGQIGDYIDLRTIYPDINVTNIIMFQGRYMRWNVEIEQWLPNSDWFTFGVPLVAPKGDKGDKGEKGDTGEKGATGDTLHVNIQAPVSLPNAGQWKIWSFVALTMAQFYSRNIAFYNQFPQIGIQGYYALYDFANVTLPLDNLFGFAVTIQPDTLYALQLPSTIEDAAKIVYCNLANHPELTNTDFVIMSEVYGNPLSVSTDPSNAAHLLAATILWVGKDQPIAMRNYIGGLRSASANIQNLPDYSYLPCTPLYGLWQVSFDFTQSPHGWRAGLNGGADMYWIAGQGWSPNAGVTAPRLKYSMAEEVTFERAEILVSNPATGTFFMFEGGEVGEPYQQFATGTPVTTNPLYWTYEGRRGIITFGTAIRANSFTRIVRATLSGTGKPPTPRFPVTP